MRTPSCRPGLLDVEGADGDESLSLLQNYTGHVRGDAASHETGTEHGNTQREFVFQHTSNMKPSQSRFHEAGNIKVNSSVNIVWVSDPEAGNIKVN